MPKLWLISDLHLETGNFRVPHGIQELADIAVLPGDIGTGRSARSLIENLLKLGLKVVYIPGNHEFYGQSKVAICNYWQQLSVEWDGFYFLNDSEATVEGVRFIGGTLWTAMNDADPDTMAIIPHIMNDYSCIYKELRKGFSKRRQRGLIIKPEDTLSWHHATRSFLESALSKADTGVATVVVTHHLPSFKSVHPRWDDYEVTGGGYASDLEDLILRYKPLLWLHGHSHDSSDYVLGNTRIVCNPRGYVNSEINPEFDPIKIIEVPIAA